MKAHRQLRLSARNPAISGPNNPGNSHAVAITARTRGRSAGDMVLAIALIDSAYAAPLPAPCTNRPATSTAIDGATAEIVRPTTYSAAVRRIIGRVPRRSAAELTIGIVPIIASAHAAPDHPYSVRLPRSLSTAGITVDTISMWIAPRVSNRSSPTTSRPFRPRKTSRHGAGWAAGAATGSITGSIGGQRKRVGP